MGTYYEWVADLDATEADAPTRRGFYGPPEEFGPTCMDEDGLSWFHDAAATWTDGDAADLECRTCGGAAPVTGGSAEGAALACLVFNFWGWDELRPEAVRVIAEATGGHRTANGSGKI